MFVEIDRLTFDYPLRRALDDISLSIPQGTITAVVGPNGAGKTTMLRCLAGLDRPSAGAIHVNGIDVLENPRMAHRQLGFLQDFFGLYDGLSVAKCLEYAARAHDVPVLERRSRIVWAAEMLDLSDRLGQRASALSRGLRQRLAIAQTIIHRPPLILLDEPAAGLDPEARANLSALILRLRDSGHTLLVSSHILADLEDYSTHMLIVEDGRIIEYTALSAMGNAVGRQRIRIAFSQPVDAAVLAAISAEFVPENPLNAVIEIPDVDLPRLALLRALVEAGLPVLSFAPEQVDLSRFYLSNVAADRQARGKQSEQ